MVSLINTDHLSMSVYNYQYPDEVVRLRGLGGRDVTLNVYLFISSYRSPEVMQSNSTLIGAFSFHGAVYHFLSVNLMELYFSFSLFLPAFFVFLRVTLSPSASSLYSLKSAAKRPF